MTVGPDLQRVAAERDDARDPEAGEGEQQDDCAVLLVLKQRKVRRIDPLREDVAAELLGQPVGDARDLAAVDDRPARQSVQSVLRLLFEQVAL